MEMMNQRLLIQFDCARVIYYYINEIIKKGLIKYVLGSLYNQVELNKIHSDIFCVMIDSPQTNQNRKNTHYGLP